MIRRFGILSMIVMGTALTGVQRECRASNESGIDSTLSLQASKGTGSATEEAPSNATDDSGMASEPTSRASTAVNDIPSESARSAPELKLIELAGAAVQTGGASWYASHFQGHRTASGERFDNYGFTAAHRTLPFGTYVRVTSLVTGKSIIVRINDRGPFVNGRIIDLSFSAAAALGLIHTRVRRVRIDRMTNLTGTLNHFGGGIS